MTQNKFWLVWVYKCPDVPQQEFNSQEEAINGAKILAKTCVGKDVCVAEVTHIIKGFVATQIMKLDTKEIGFSINIDDKNNNVNGLPYPVDTEICLSEPVTDETPKPKFKVGDIVTINAVGFESDKFEITHCNTDISNKNGNFYSVKNIQNQDERSHGINESDISLADTLKI